MGAAVNVRLILPWTEDFNTAVLAIGGVLTAIAIVGKVIAGWAGPWEKMNRLAVGVGMIPRGEVGLIFADIGRRSGMLSEPVFSAILIMVMASTFITPPLLKWIFHRSQRREDDGTASPEPAESGGGGFH